MFKLQTTKEIFGTPKGTAKRIEYGFAKSAWEYRGFKFRGRKNPGWASGMTFDTYETPGGYDGITASAKLIMMTKIDRAIERVIGSEQAKADWELINNQNH